ncbi:hypothetical protein [Siculibacillus lacustris]|nr:hypothetical protein [Siculibacillus lacustris]
MLGEMPSGPSAEEILAEPGFPRARSAYIVEMLEQHEDQPALNQMLFDEGRAFIFLTIITMHAGYLPDDRNTWPTIQLLQQEMTKHGIASGGRVRDLVRRLSDIGYLDVETAPGDRRVKLLKPSQKMLSQDQRILRVYYRPLHELFPVPGYPEPMRGDPQFQAMARQIGFAFIDHARRFIMANPTIAFFLPRQAGIMVLTKLMQLWLETEADAAQEISFIDLGESFGISRTHVRELLRGAGSQGLLRLRGNSVTLEPGCRAGFDRFLADTMAGSDLVYRLARQRLAGTT